MSRSRKIFGFLLLASAGVPFAEVPPALASIQPVTANSLSATAPITGFGTISGVVRDESGAAIGGAMIALLRDGVAAVRQVRSNSDGGFSVRVAAPGRYSLTAMAEGFSIVSLANVEVERAEDVAFRFNLVRIGSGNTLPEQRADRNQPKWIHRANQSRRTVYQNNQGTGETTAAVEKIETPPDSIETDDSFNKRGQSAVETYFASSATGANYVGLNFATVLQPINENFDVIVAGQTGIGAQAPNRLETTTRLKLNGTHQVSFNVGGAKLGKVRVGNNLENELGQLSFQAMDEWRVRDGMIIVVGVDYARFVGASSAYSIAPRLGLQFETNAKTRVSAAYTTQNETRSWSNAADLEDGRVLFRAPDFENYAVADKRVLMPKMRRFELGVERVLDNSSSVEATVFFDTTNNRGVSLANSLLTNADNDAAQEETNNSLAQLSNAVQNGSAQGMRVIYSRRLNDILSVSAGYAAGRGQKLSNKGLSNPANLFDDDFFQTVTAQLAADFGSGTQVRTVWRYSPRSAVFAIDPFAGRIAYYEPSLSVLVTQNIPTWGLPIQAKAMLDARNLFDFTTVIADGEQSIQINSNRRILRGGIAVRF